MPGGAAGIFASDFHGAGTDVVADAEVNGAAPVDVACCDSHPSAREANAANQAQSRRTRTLGSRAVVSVPQSQFFHLELQTLAGQLEQARGVRDVTVGLLQGALDQLPLQL